MYIKVKQKFDQLPPEFAEEILSIIRNEFLSSEKTIIVLDDDPTGTQTSYDVTVLTSWRVDLITEELNKKPSVLFILTNSRSLNEKAAVQLAFEIGHNVKAAVKESGRQIVLISRSDSTLRGHYPAEVDAIATALDMTDAVTVLVPAFIEGGRYTIDDIHYLEENEELVPVSDTPFAKDVVFGYQHAGLKHWVEEKTKGRIKAAEVNSVSLGDIRIGGPQMVSAKLKSCGSGSVCIINAASYRDLEVFAMGVMSAEKSGKKFLYRSSATIVPIRAGLVSGRIFTPKAEDSVSKNGSLVIVGSHVPKTTSQLSFLLQRGTHISIEVNVEEILHSSDRLTLAKSIIQKTDNLLAAGNNVVIYTSRKLEVGQDTESSLKINAIVSEFLVSIVSGLSVRPKFIIAKGGITSSDIATKALGVEKARVLGPVIPGVPVWRLDASSKFPEIMYVVFPGNVGDQKSISEVCERLNG